MGAAQNEGTVVDLDLQHPFLHNCKTRTTATETNLLATIPSQLPTFKKWKEQLESLNESLPQQHYLLLPKGHKFDEGGVCSTSGELQMEYDYYPRLLSSQITLRKKESKRFTEGELWYLLYALVMAKNTLGENGELVGDVHPRNVFLNNTGDIKVACLRSWPGQVSNYRRAVLEEESGYLAPEDFERLRLGAMDNQINAESEIFSIGLTLLTTASLQFQQELYNMKEKEFQQQVFYSRLGKFQHDALYSEIFRAVISNLLEVDPAKRMDLAEAKIFLEKHTENIIAKKPLKINNVGKKLQVTINIMFKAVRQVVTNEQKPPDQVGNIPNASIIKPGGTRVSGQRIMNYINFQEKRGSQENILPPPHSQPLPLPKSQTSIQVNSQNNFIIPPSANSNVALAKPPMPVSYLVTMINKSNEQPHRPAISKTFSSTILAAVPSKTEIVKPESPKYRPFEAISRGQIEQAAPLKEQEPIILKQSPSITPEIKSELPIKSNEQIKEAVEKPTSAEIWLGQQTSIGKLNILMDTKRQGGFGHNLIDPNYEPENIEQPPLQSLHASHESKEPQDVVQQVKEQLQQSPLQQSEQKESKISQKQETPESHSLIKESKAHSGIDHSHHCSSDNNGSLLLNNSGKASQVQGKEEGQNNIEADAEIENQKQSQISQHKNSEASQKSNKIEVVQLQINNESKPFSPLVKVWGMNMGFNRTKRQEISTEAAINVKPVEIISQKADEKHPHIQQIHQKTNQEETQNPKQQRYILQSEVVRKQSQIGNVPSVHKENTKNGSKLLAESNELIKDYPQQNNNYILIQEESKHTIEHDQSSQMPNLHVLKEQIKQKQSEILQYHTYADISTNGTFEECWHEILVFLTDPTDYTARIDPCKVKIRINDDRWSLKVGPGVFDILLNKEQGKFMLKNCEGSRCEGEMLGGVYKDQEKKHRLWFNSAYYYNGVKIPSREIIEECLEKCKENVNSKK